MTDQRKAHKCEQRRFVDGVPVLRCKREATVTENGQHWCDYHSPRNQARWLDAVDEICRMEKTK